MLITRLFLLAIAGNVSPLVCEPPKDIQITAAEWSPMDKQLQGRQAFEAEWLLDGEVFNSRFHSLLDERTAGQG